MLTRERKPRIRLAALDVLIGAFKTVGAELVILMPDMLSFLSELMEDEDPRVERCTHSLILLLQDLSGEDLQEYLTG